MEFFIIILKARFLPISREMNKTAPFCHLYSTDAQYVRFYKYLLGRDIYILPPLPVDLTFRKFDEMYL